MNFLIIQTAFIGDVILATSAIEKLHHFYPGAKIDVLVRKGNESLLEGHPLLRSVLIWDKKINKLGNLFRLSTVIRKSKYDYVINLHRFASSGLITFLSGANYKIGFDKNPFSFTFTKKVKHIIGNGTHETERIQLLLEDITDKKTERPKLYPSSADYFFVKKFQSEAYVCIAPTSVWFTKQWPAEKWILLCNKLSTQKIYLVGAPGDVKACEEIKNKSENKNIEVLTGKLSFLESAALMQRATMNYVNDSAPLHIASAMNAPVTAIFCSTVPAFGFGPLSDTSIIIETKEKLNCRPCGLHGYKACPKGHFKCAETSPPAPLPQERGDHYD